MLFFSSARAFDARGVLRSRESWDGMERKTSRRIQRKPDASWLGITDDYARREPTKAIVAAAGAGFLINLLPIGAIVGALAAVAFALARPALLFLGLLKAYEFLRTKPTNQD